MDASTVASGIDSVESPPNSWRFDPARAAYARALLHATWTRLRGGMTHRAQRQWDTYANTLTAALVKLERIAELGDGQRVAGLEDRPLDPDPRVTLTRVWWIAAPMAVVASRRAGRRSGRQVMDRLVGRISRAVAGMQRVLEGPRGARRPHDVRSLGFVFTPVDSAAV